MHPDPDITLIVPQRNQGTLTLTCLRTLRRAEKTCWPIVVVDDGSSDGSRELVEQAGLTNCVVISQPPRGVTAAWNAGILAADTTWVVLLNNDVLVDGPFVEALVQPLRTRQALITGVEWRTEPLIPDQFVSQLLHRRLLGGWCFACAKSLWRELQGFDESLQLYYSDTDFQCRAATDQRAAVVPAVLCVVPSLPLRHLGHQTTRHEPGRRALWLADRVRFQSKWMP